MASLGSLGKTSLDIYKSEAIVAEADGALLKCDTEQETQNGIKNPSEYVKRTIKQFEVSGNQKVCEEKQEAIVINCPSSTDNDFTQKSEKKPSYLGLACSVSGYSGITTYDSKLREGFRSRDHSPGRIDLLKSRDTSPLPLASVSENVVCVKSDSLNVPQKFLYSGLNASTVSKCKVPASLTNSAFQTCVNEGTEAHTGSIALNEKESDKTKANCKSFENMAENLKFSPEKLETNYNDVKELRSSTNIRESTRSFMSTMLNSSCTTQSDFFSNSTVVSSRDAIYSSKEHIHHNDHDSPDCIPSLSTYSCVNPVRVTDQKQSPGTVRVVEFTSQKKSYVQTVSTQSSLMVENGQMVMDSRIANGESSKSFIQQRVERLYGPGALAQGFFKRMSLTPTKISDESQAKESPSGVGAAATSGTSPVLPVFRHLRPEFRAQLPLGNIAKRMEKEQLDPVKSQMPEPECQPDLQPAAPEVVLPQPALSESSEPVDSTCKDGHYFLKQLKQEIERLNGLVADAEQELASGKELPEEALGKLRAASGQARLLIRQKLQQFEGLCQKNIIQNSEEEFPTTSEDLEGFWDMVKLQIDHVDRLFEEIKQLRMANWIEVKPKSEPSSVKRRTIGTKRGTTKSSEVNEAARKTREEARRKMMEERRRAMKQQKPVEGIEIFVPQENGK